MTLVLIVEATFVYSYRFTVSYVSQEAHGSFFPYCFMNKEVIDIRTGIFVSRQSRGGACNEKHKEQLHPASNDS